MVEEAGDGEGADAADLGGDGGEIFSLADTVGEVTLEDAFFAGSAGIN